jgi:cold-inducible RNA-binding protein
MVGNSLERNGRSIIDRKQIIMSMRLYIGNLPYTATENELQDLFGQHGPVTSVDLVMDKFSGRPRGFGFITMETKEGAEAAIQALNGKDMGGRELTVNEARPREERAPRSGGGGGGGYRGDRGGDRGSRREYSR